MTAPDDPRARAEHLRRLAADWGDELRAAGSRPRLRRGTKPSDYRSRCEPWQHLSDAIFGALDLADALDPIAPQRPAQALSAEQRAVELRRAGLTFRAVAGELGVPIGSVKTWVRRARMVAV